MTEAIERELRAVYGAYEYLREHDLAPVSTTSKLLRTGDLAALARRVGDEIGELRGVVAGTHGHGGGRDDIVLEAYQTLYWLTVLSVAAGERYDEIRPHEILELETPPDDAASSLHAWSAPGLDWHDACRRRRALHEGFATVAACCRTAGVAVAEPVRRDRAELRAKPYLAPYWAQYDQRQVAHT